MARDAWERVVAARRAGVYESNYLKANSPDGARGLWIKHNLLRPAPGVDAAPLGEFWVVVFAKGQAPLVAKREVPFAEVELDPAALRIHAGEIALVADRARGRIADLTWDLRLTGGLEPLHHLPADLLYRTAFPKKKILTPRPNLRFDGHLEVAGERWEVSDWVGLRGHNWGSEHAHTYAYGNCNLWDDGDPTRTVDGFSAKILLAGRPSPWLSAAVVRHPDVARNQLRRWWTKADVTPERWSVAWPARLGTAVALTMTTRRDHYVGLRYAHPGGAESYCYNTKFAQTELTVRGHTWTSRCGELETLFPEPLPDVPLHPTPDWTQAAGDYRG